MGQLRRRYEASDVVTAYNNTGSTITSGTFVKKDTTAEQCVTIAAGTDPIWGVVINDIPTGTYGSVQIRGLGIANVDSTGVTAGDKIMSTAGLATTWAATGGTNRNMAGIANTTGPANGQFEIELSGPAVFEQG